MGTDPRNNDTIFVVFSGRDEFEPVNLDLFLARARNAGASDGPTFLSTPEDNQRSRLMDNNLRIPPGPGPASSEFHPCGAIDGLGGFNLLFIRTEEIGWNTSLPPPLVTVRYARWASLDLAMAGQPPPFIVDLSLPFRMWPYSLGYDYISLVAVGCDVYAAWSEQTSAGVWGLYAAHIVADVSCIYNGPIRP